MLQSPNSLLTSELAMELIYSEGIHSYSLQASMQNVAMQTLV